jgi:hypothetical protein
MKYLKRFNESMEEQIYQQVLDSIRECFLEFEDNGWSWQASSDDNLSSHPIPYFKYIMKDGNKEELKYYIDCVGTIDSNGEIKWESKDIYHAETLIQQQLASHKPLYKILSKIKRKKFEITEGPILEEFEDFTIGIKRLHEETGLDFKFSYDNIDGQKRIIIQGRI